MVFLTESVLHFGELAANRSKVAIFGDDQFDEGSGEASVQIARKVAGWRNADGLDDPFAIINLDKVVEQFRRWRAFLPHVKPFYAVKCNNDPVLLRLLADLGCGFDCASRGEIEAIVGNGLASGMDIVYANPCKTRSYIQHADRVGVRQMTFDSVEELTKIKEVHSSPQLILRISVADPTAQCPLATKFGCDAVAEAPKLMKDARKLDIELIGISFHVGSGCRDPSAFRLAIEASRRLFELGRSLGHQMRLLDIGGGFPGHNTEEITFEEIVSVIHQSLSEFFPLDSWPVEVIAEPGRYFASSPVSLCTNVIAVHRVPAERVTKLEEDENKEGYMLYINDGVYGSFNCILFDHFQPRGRALFDEQEKDKLGTEGEQQKLFPTIVWGQTCDGLDQVEAHTQMHRMNVGEWLYYENMGAYTSVAASNFNGFDKPQPFYIISEGTWNAIYRNGKAKENE